MLLSTLFFFGIISIALYLLVLRPVQPTVINASATAGSVGGHNPAFNNSNTRNAVANRARPQEAAGAAAPARGGAPNKDSNIDRVLSECSTFPIHITPTSQGICRTGGFNLLNEGLLAFRHTKAVDYENPKTSSSLASSSTGDVASQNRKERARVLSRMLALESSSSESVTPPPRGSTFVISIPAAEVSCPKLRQVMYLFATYYNLLVILVLPPGGGDKTLADVKELTIQLRGSGDQDPHRLALDILPDHRIVAATSPSGRIAFVRQLARAEIVLDFDIEVKTQLTRFGYRVIHYKQPSFKPNTSQLGSQLLP